MGRLVALLPRISLSLSLSLLLSLFAQPTAESPLPHSGGCSDAKGCYNNNSSKAHEAFHAYAEWHIETLRQLARSDGKQQAARRPGVVLCHPEYGLGNRIRGIMTCFSVAFFTKRLLFIDWYHKYAVYSERLGSEIIYDMPGGQPASLEELFETPGFDWGLQALETLYDTAEITEAGFKFINGADDEKTTVKRRNRQFLCDDLGEAWASDPIVIIRSYVWYNFLLKNKRYANKSRDMFGTDSAGVLGVFQQWGALLFRPQKVVREMMGAIEDAMIPGAYRVGIHVRIGGNWYDQADLFNGMTGRSPLLAERAAGCALSTLPMRERSRPVNYLVISDKAVGKKAVVSTLEMSEAGPGAEKRRMGDAEVQEALGIVNETHKKWLSALDVTGWDLGGGSRAIVIGSFGSSSEEDQGPSASRNTTLDIQQALAEMFVLGAVDSLVRTTDSSFSIVAYSFRSHRHDGDPASAYDDGTRSRQKETWYVEDGDGGDHWCHKQHSSEPQVWGTLSGVADTAVRHGGGCVSQKTAFDWSWARTTA